MATLNKQWLDDRAKELRDLTSKKWTPLYLGANKIQEKAIEDGMDEVAEIMEDLIQEIEDLELSMNSKVKSILSHKVHYGN